jgi:hypothetical protein
MSRWSFSDFFWHVVSRQYFWFFVGLVLVCVAARWVD